MANCTNCGTLLAEQSKFCNKCGTQAAAATEPGAISSATQSPGTVQAAGEYKSCPYCGEQIMLAAMKCKHCQSVLGGSLMPQQQGGVMVQGPNIPNNQPTIVIQNVQTQQAPPAHIYRQIKSPGTALFLSIIFPGGGQFYNGHVGKGIFVFFTCWLWLPYIWSWYDAYTCAKRINATGA